MTTALLHSYPCGTAVIRQNAIYASVDRSIRGAIRAGGVVASRVWGRDGDGALESQARTCDAIAAINGLYGDQLAERGNGLALTMQIRHCGKPVALTAESLADAFPAATGRLAVVVHGVFLSESWWRGPRTGDDHRSHGQRLQDDLGFTPVYLRYNSGLHISHNGRALADMLH